MRQNAHLVRIQNCIEVFFNFCLLEADGMTFNGRWDAETDTVTFLPIQYAEHPSGQRRWKAPEVKTSYDAPQGSFDQNAKESKPKCMGVSLICHL